MIRDDCRKQRKVSRHDKPLYLSSPPDLKKMTLFIRNILSSMNIMVDNISNNFDWALADPASVSKIFSSKYFISVLPVLDSCC